MSLIFHETTSFVSHAYTIKWSDPIDNGLYSYSRMLRVWPYLRISYITFNTILCFKILPMCVGSFFPLTKAKITLFRVMSVTPSLYTMWCILSIESRFQQYMDFPNKTLPNFTVKQHADGFPLQCEWAYNSHTLAEIIMESL